MDKDFQINPFYLLPPGKTVIVNEDDKQFSGIAAVREIGKEKYEIRINLDNAFKMYKKSWVYGMAEFDAFVVGLKLHEICHIIYEAFRAQDVVKNGVYHFIQNVLLDAQGEYSFTRDAPGVTKYIRLILTVLRRDADLKVDDPNNEELVEKANEIQKYLDTLFYLVRFGTVKQGADPRFVNFVFPYILASTRKTVDEVNQVTKIIYQYLLLIFDDPESRNIIEQSVGGDRGMTVEELEEAMGGEKISSNDTATVLTDIKGGLFGGKTAQEVQVKEEGNEFYRETVRKYADTINAIRRAFKLRLEKLALVPAYDGDLNLKRQQQAYINSFTQESQPDYQIMKRVEQWLDVVIIRDISASTSGIYDEYCKLTIAILAALNGLPGIRVAQIDFSDYAILNLNFGEPVRQGRIFPRYESGTQLIPAFDLVEKLHFTARKRIGITITDGWIGDDFEERELELARKLRFRNSKWEIGSGRGGDVSMRYTTLENFPIDISRWLLTEL
jgi:hypothetical protein